jgi:triphosphatase
MEMEFELHPDDAARLPRLKALAPAGAVRARTQPFRTVWHDSPHRDLARQGLSFAHAKAGWCLERMTPGAGTWLPGQLPPCLETAETIAGITHPLPEPLPPAAALEGRQAGFSLDTESGPVRMNLLRGVLRTVEAEHPISRLTMSGGDTAVRDLALKLSETLRLSVPRCSLAAEALATADGTPPPPRRLGAPDLPDHSNGPLCGPLSIPEMFRHAIGHLTDVILYCAPAAAGGTAGTEPVHQMRVAVRRARSVITVFRDVLGCPAVDRANDVLKGFGARLGPARDWDVFVTETAPAVTAAFPGNPRLERLLAAADRRRRECHAGLDAYLESCAFRALGLELAWVSASRSWQEALEPERQEALTQPPHEFAAFVLQRRLKKLLALGKNIKDLDIPSLHGVRLSAKRLRYAAETFAALYPGKATARFIRRLSRLQQSLGVLNDGAVAAQLLDELGGPGGRHGHPVGLVLGFLAAGAATVRPDILRTWGKFQSQPPFWS